MYYSCSNASPLPPDADTKFGHSELNSCWEAQGGGVYVHDGTVKFDACMIYGNLAYLVSCSLYEP